MKNSISLLLALISVTSLASAMDNDESLQIHTHHPKNQVEKQEDPKKQLQRALAQVGLKATGKNQDAFKTHNRIPFGPEFFAGIEALVHLRKSGVESVSKLAYNVLKKLSKSSHLLRSQEAKEALEKNEYDSFKRLVLNYKDKKTGVQKLLVDKRNSSKKLSKLYEDFIWH